MLTAKEIDEARLAIHSVMSFCPRHHGKEMAMLNALCAQAHLTAEALSAGDFAGHTPEDFDAAK